MSVVVYRDGVLAADSGVFTGSVRTGSISKIWRFANGEMAGSIGSCSDDEAFLAWMRGGQRPTTLSNGFEAIVVQADGTVSLLGGPNGAPYQPQDDFYAIGAGADIAYGALEMGATAVDAVRVACKRNVYCALPIEELSLGDD